MSTSKHKDAAKMRRKQWKRERFLSAFIQPDGSLLPKAERRVLQKTGTKKAA